MSRNRNAWTLAAALALVTSSPARAENQDGLTPTDVLDFGQVSATVVLSVGLGQGTLVNPVLDVDVDFTRFDLLLSGTVGLGAGFEVGLDIPHVIRQTVEADGTLLGVIPAESEEVDTGFGDMTLTGTYRLLEEGDAIPQWIVSAILTMPTGNDKRGDAKEKLSGITVQDGERGGVGLGVWHYGLGTAVSKRIGVVEPYAGLSYVFGGDRERNDIDEERADVLTGLLGAEFHVGEGAAIDVRLGIDLRGEDVTEVDRLENTEEAFLQYRLGVTTYLDVAPSVTLLAGIGALYLEDHVSSEEFDETTEDILLYQFLIGIHIVVGGP